MDPELILDIMNSDIAKETAPKMMPKMMPLALEKFLQYIPEEDRKKFIAKIVDIVVDKDEKKEVSAEYLDLFETLLNVKGLRVHSRGGKGSTKDKISPMDMFLSGLCGCICIAVGNSLKDNNINAEVYVKGKVEKSFEKGKIKKITLDIYVKADDIDIDKEDLKKMVLEGSKKCLISNSLNCDIEKNIIL